MSSVIFTSTPNSLSEGGRDNVQAQAGLEEVPTEQSKKTAEWWHSQVFPARSVERFPKPRVGGYFLTQGKPKKGNKPVQHQYIHVVGLHLNKVALRMLNNAKRYTVDRDLETHRVTWTPATRSLSHDELAEALYEYVEAHAGHLIVWEYDGVNNGDRSLRLLQDRLVEKVHNVAEFALEAWDPEYTARLSRQGARGGKKSKRPKVWSVDDLRPYKDLTRRQQMEELGCKETKIKELRRALEAEEAQNAERLSETQLMTPEQGGRDKPTALEIEIDALLAPREVIRRAPRVDHELVQMDHEILVAELGDTFDSAMAAFDEYQTKLTRHEALGDARWNADLESGWLDQVLAA